MTTNFASQLVPLSVGLHARNRLEGIDSMEQIWAHVSPSLTVYHEPQRVVVPLATVAFVGGSTTYIEYPVLGFEVAGGFGRKLLLDTNLPAWGPRHNTLPRISVDSCRLSQK